GSASGAQQRHRTADVDAVDLVTGNVFLEWEGIPTRKRYVVDFSRARPEAAVVNHPIDPVGQPRLFAKRLSRHDALDEPDESFFPFAEHHDVDRRGTQYKLRYSRAVLAAQHHGRIGK